MMTSAAHQRRQYKTISEEAVWNCEICLRAFLF
jgi:hypothetical protein